MSDYGTVDWWSTSPAEELKKQYTNLANYLNREIASLQRKYAEVEKHMYNGNDAMAETVSGCQGCVSQLLIESVAKIKSELSYLLAIIDNAIQDLTVKLNIANSRVSQLQWYCNDEDYREKEYTYRQIHLK